MNSVEQFAALGKTGLKVSRIALGCGFRGIYDSSEAANTIEYALDCGINLIDCADIYKLRSGIHAEEVLSSVLRKRREQVIITSKFGGQMDEQHPVLNNSGASRTYMIRAVEASLKRLKTDYIDIYFLHVPDDETSWEETMRAFDQLCRDGKIRYAGLCNHKAWQIVGMQSIQKRFGGCPVSVIQNPYSLLNRSGEEELFPAAKYENMGIMVYSPLAAGLLGGAFAKNHSAPSKSTWGYDPDYKFYMKHIFPGRISSIVDTVFDLAKKYEVSSAALATAWVLKNANISTVIAGSDTPAELIDSIRATTLELTEGDAAYLDYLSDGMREVFSHPEVQKRVIAIRTTKQAR